MFELIESLPLPKNLCELGIEQNKLSELAANTMEDYMMFYSPRPIKKSEIIAILESVW
jgi:alcohol dehydrogenase class IV